MAKRILAFITTLAIWSVAMAQDGWLKPQSKLCDCVRR